jgi:catechol 2,3-dioxygenase-like lactoylglutathione lyase family enzyme
MSIDGLISWVYTGDLDATASFYQQTLGFICERDEGRARIFRVAPNACIGVCEAFDGRVVQADGGMISIVTSDVDVWYQRPLAHGLELEPPQRLEAFGIYSMLVHDPNGYAIEFQQFDE